MPFYKVSPLNNSVGVNENFKKDLEKAQKQRAFFSKKVQELKLLQKQASNEKDFDLSRFYSLEAKDYLKNEKAFDFVVKWIEGDPEYFSHTPKYASSELSKYIDNAFNFILFGESCA
jgi:hypothetical protein